MPRPMSSATGKVTTFRRNLDTWREEDRERFAAEVLRVKALYRQVKSVKATAKALGVGKRTLERAIRDITELGEAIKAAQALLGR